MTALKIWKNEWYTDSLRTCRTPLYGGSSALLLPFLRWMRQITWARRRCIGLPAAVTCRPAGCCWAPAPTRCCRRNRDCRRLSWAMKACRRYCRVSWRTVVSGSLLGFYCLLNVCVCFSRGSSDRQLWGGPPAAGSLQNRRSGNCEGKSTLWRDLWFNFKMMMTIK